MTLIYMIEFDFLSVTICPICVINVLSNGTHLPTVSIQAGMTLIYMIEFDFLSASICSIRVISVL